MKNRLFFAGFIMESTIVIMLFAILEMAVFIEKKRRFCGLASWEIPHSCVFSLVDKTQQHMCKFRYYNDL
jgi:hypothetical protein